MSGGAELRCRLEAVGIADPVTPEQSELLWAYLELLRLWNAKMNLTALEDASSAIGRLIAEPVLASRFIDAGARSLLDVGSGGGSPAVPLKIMRPDLSLTMVEVKTRKSVFLREVIRHLRLQDARVVTGRFEAVLPAIAERGGVDVISLRAVRAGDSEVRLLADALRAGGQQMWFLGEGQGVPSLPGVLSLQHDVTLMPPLHSRLLVVRKTA